MTARFSIGSVVAGYRVERVLGSGGMGTVYLARDPDLPRHDALKVLSAELCRDPDFRARFVREADVASALDHPNIVAIYRRGQFEGQLWIAMQFVDGTNADDALRAGTMTPPRAIHIVSEVAKALDYAHQRNVVHRDIKPANFLLSNQAGPEERVLLGDFGIARALDDTGLTGTGAVMATVSYAAPELLAGHRFDGSADLYSLGCTLFRLLTGRTPFSTANGMAAVMLAHLNQPPPKVTDQMPWLPARLDHVIATAMAKDPAHRFSSARQFAAAAAEALHDRTTPPTMPQHATALAPPPRPPTKPTHRRRIAAAAATTAIIATAITTATLLNHSSTHTIHTTTPTTTESSPSPTTPATTAIPALKQLLLPADEITTIMVGPRMEAAPVHDNLFDDAANMSDRSCVGAWLPAQATTYTGGGWDAGEAQKLRSPDAQVWQHGVIQAVIGFPSERLAQKFLNDQTNVWKACARKPFTVTPAGSTAQNWTFGDFAVVDGALTVTFAIDGGPSTCEHVLGVRSNVVIDVLACRPDIVDQAKTIVNNIDARVAHA